MIIYNNDVDLEVSDTCVGNSLLSRVELQCDVWSATLPLVEYRIGTVGTGCCLYAPIYIHNIINDTIALRIISAFGSQKWCFKIIQNILVRPKLI